MLNKKIWAAIVLLAATSCSNESELTVNDAQAEQNVQVPVKVHVSGYAVTQDDFPATRAAQDVNDYNGVKAITLAFYSGSTQAYTATQLREDASTYTTFGEFECALPMGSYTMVVIARGHGEGDVFTLTSPTEAAYTSDHTRETFAATQAVSITSTNSVDISATLNRIVAKLQVISSDGRTADANNVRMTMSAGSKGFNPTTGLANSNTGFSNTVPISAAVGNISNSASYLFLTADEQNIDVTIETLDADGNTLFSKTVENVPFKRNRVTKLTGAMYTNDALSGTFQLETAWLSDYNADF